jgi:hypothetical protein
MLPKGQVSSPRKLVWIDEQGFSGWGCSECIWVFNNPSGWPPGNSLDEMKRILQVQLDKEFESHICKKAASAPVVRCDQQCGPEGRYSSIRALRLHVAHRPRRSGYECLLGDHLG